MQPRAIRGASENRKFSKSAKTVILLSILKGGSGGGAAAERRRSGGGAAAERRAAERRRAASENRKFSKTAKTLDTGAHFERWSSRIVQPKAIRGASENRKFSKSAKTVIVLSVLKGGVPQ